MLRNSLAWKIGDDVEDILQSQQSLPQHKVQCRGEQQRELVITELYMVSSKSIQPKGRTENKWYQ